MTYCPEFYCDCSGYGFYDHSFELPALSQIKENTSKVNLSTEVTQEALRVKYYTAQIQQFVTDTSLVGDREGVEESKNIWKSRSLRDCCCCEKGNTHQF